MARRVRTVTKTTSEPTEPKRNRRTPEEIVADLQAEIERVKARAAAKKVKANPQGKALLVAAKALDKAIEVCSGDIRHAAESARAVLAEQMVAIGIRAPKSNGRGQRSREVA